MRHRKEAIVFKLGSTGDFVKLPGKFTFSAALLIKLVQAK